MPSYQEAYEKQVAAKREERLVLAGKGDLLTHRIDSLAVVDSEPGQIMLDLTENRNTVLPSSNYRWKDTYPFGSASEPHEVKVKEAE